MDRRWRDQEEAVLGGEAVPGEDEQTGAILIRGRQISVTVVEPCPVEPTIGARLLRIILEKARWAKDGSLRVRLNAAVGSDAVQGWLVTALRFGDEVPPIEGFGLAYLKDSDAA